MILCSFVCGRSCCPSPLRFQSDLSTASLCLRSAELLLRTPVQVGLGTLTPQLPESLHVSLLRCPGPRFVLLCQDACHSAVCNELLRLRLRILEVQFDLLLAHNRCYLLFILCNLEHGGNREMCGYASGAHQTDITERVFADTIRKYHINSAPRSCMHVACRRTVRWLSLLSTSPDIDGRAHGPALTIASLSRENQDPWASLQLFLGTCDTLRKVPHLSNEGVALQARV